jgi:hypothetical protein
MRYLTLGFIFIASCQPMSQSGETKLPNPEQLSRACIYQAGGWTSVDCSAAAAYSAELNEWSRYVIQCTGDAYWAPGIAGSGVDADSSDGYLPAGSWLDFYTSDLITYYSCEASGSSGICRHIECK